MNFAFEILIADFTARARRIMLIPVIQNASDNNTCAFKFLNFKNQSDQALPPFIKQPQFTVVHF